MKNSVLFFLVSFLSFYGNSQSQITLSGYIYDADTKLALPYVNIGFVEKAVGTVSDDGGYFELTYRVSKISNTDLLQISSIGYKTKKIQASEFYSQISKSPKIYLNPERYGLDEVLISNERQKEVIVGSSKTKEGSVGYWFNKEALGGEIATKVNIKHKNSQLLDLRLQIVKNNSGSIKVRVNVYEDNNGMPGKNLLKEHVLHTISKPFGEEIIDLKPYNIVVHDDIIVSIELVKVYGIYIDFVVATSRFKGKAYTRHLSQDAWKRYHETKMAFSLNTSYPDKKNSAKDLTREMPEKVTLYWDRSLSMQDRNLGKELDVLSNYLKKVKPKEVEVIKFNTILSDPKTFELKKGKNEDLITYLQHTQYEGGTNYAQILKENKFGAEAALVFTDGHSNFEPIEQLLYIPAFYISSIEGTNQLKLQEQAEFGEGYYLDLNALDTKQALNVMLNEINDETVYTSTTKNEETVYGKITSDSLIIQGARINVKGNYVQAISDVDGNYSIPASEDDVLEVSALGMLPQKILVSNRPEININLRPDGQLLDEVLLEAETTSSETVETAYGKKNKDAIGYTYDEVKKESIHSGILTIDQVIMKIPGIIKRGIGNGTRFLFARNIGSTMSLNAVPIIVIDDIIYYQSDGYDYLPKIDPQTIESVMAFKSVISANRFGSAGAYGAIVIKTDATYVSNENPNNIKPSALIQGNDYVEGTVLAFESNGSTSKYIKQLEQATTFETALKIYQTHKKQIDQITIPFLLEASDYFMKWDSNYAFYVLSNIAEIAFNNPKALLTLAYKLEEVKRYKEAKYIYQRIAELRPNDSQSYRNLAQIYEKTGNYKEAMNLYKQILSNSIEGVSFKGLEMVIANEFSHFLALHRSKVDYSDIPSDYLNSKFKYDKRFVFEWNEPTAEFELQFVNPQKKYFKWSHTQLDNPERMFEEVKQGYATEEYIIDEAEQGEWIINIESLTEEGKLLNPTYLKYTVYKNYGLPTETQEVKVVKLNDCKPKVTFDKFLSQ